MTVCDKGVDSCPSQQVSNSTRLWWFNAKIHTFEPLCCADQFQEAGIQWLWVRIYQTDPPLPCGLTSSGPQGHVAAPLHDLAPVADTGCLLKVGFAANLQRRSVQCILIRSTGGFDGKIEHSIQT